MHLDERVGGGHSYREEASIGQAIELAQSLSYEALQSLSTGNREDYPPEQISRNSSADLDYAFWESWEEQALAEKFYNQTIDYEQLFLGPERRKRSKEGGEENEYSATTASSDVERESMTREEAEEMVKEVNYAALLGTLSELSHVRRKRFALWAELNRADVALFHSVHGLTNEVDYSRVF